MAENAMLNLPELTLSNANLDLQDCITSGDLTEFNTILLPFRDPTTPGLLIPDAREQLKSCMLVAMDTGQFSLAQSLLDQGVGVDDRSASPAIAHALDTGSTSILEMLLEYGWEIEHAFNTVDDTTRKSLFQNESLVKWLLSYGADPSAVSWFGMVPIEGAAQYAPLPILKLLMSNGVRVQSTDAIVKASIGHADNEPERLEVVRYLVGCGAPINAHDMQFCDFNRCMSLMLIKGKLTALHHAARTGKADMVALLLHMGADRNLTTFAEKTALELAIENGHEEVASLLRI